MKQKTGPAKILVIDDTALDTHIFEILAKRILPDVEITHCINGQFALDKLNEPSTHNQAHDYIFVDLTMPVMNGWEFLDEYLKVNIDPFKKSRVFILSSSFSGEDVIRSQSYPFVEDFIMKPLSLQKLQQVFDVEAYYLN